MSIHARERVYCCRKCDLEFKALPGSLACPECGSARVVVKDLYEGVNYSIVEFIVSEDADKYLKSKDRKITIGRTRVKVVPCKSEGFVTIRVREESGIGLTNTNRLLNYLMDRNVRCLEEAHYVDGFRQVWHYWGP
jgi:DNA-directed RNA polymerase subunit RPC12/RpoP